MKGSRARQRCFIGNLTTIVDAFLEDARCQEDKDGPLNSALSRMQRSLNSRSLVLESDKKVQLEIQDCTVSEVVGSFCLKDVERLASNLIVLLASENSFTKHSVRKTFMALFSYLHGSVSLGVSLTGFLWNALIGCFVGEREFESMKRSVNSSCVAMKYGYSTSGSKVGMLLLQILHDILRKFKLEELSNLEDFVACTEAQLSECYQRGQDITRKSHNGLVYLFPGGSLTILLESSPNRLSLSLSTP
ncbi:hypothetical protein L7F22_011121 [Adiantum nelumboides]|nr:hypothetical protein [Adiantum nelumboides]